MLGKKLSPRLEKLEKEFLESGGEWKNVKIGDIFDLNSSKKIFHANNSTIYENRVEKSYPYIVRSTQLNGRKGFLKEDSQYLNEGNTISFAQDTFSIFYQKEPYFTGNKVKILKSKFNNFNYKIAHYIISSLDTTLRHYSWGIGSTVESIKNIKFILPFKNGEIYFSYMEKYIEELEALRIEELEAYLKATGLKNFKLSQKDVKSLNEFKQISSILPPPTRKIIMQKAA